MKVAITGGVGFIGRAVVERLTERGDEVVALVRDTARSRHLKAERVQLVANDLSDVAGLATQFGGADAVIQAAGQYRIGIKPSERPQMSEANVGATERVLAAAVAAAVKRIVHVSTANVFGNTRGQIVDETFRRDEKRGFASWYDETKYRAHQAAESRIARGAPIAIVMPSQVYGPKRSLRRERPARAGIPRQVALHRVSVNRFGLGARSRSRRRSRGGARPRSHRRVIRAGWGSTSNARSRRNRRPPWRPQTAGARLADGAAAPRGAAERSTGWAAGHPGEPARDDRGR